MAHLWQVSGDGEWRFFPLVGDLLALPPGGPPRALAAIGGDGASLALRRVAGSDGEAWLLLAANDVPALVNGFPLDTGIAALADRDEIRVPAWPPVFFSTEQLATVVPYPVDGPRGFCPRCKRAITVGEPAVQCPGCGLWHHAPEQQSCWTYDAKCGACRHPTALDAGFQWTPEEL